MDSNAKIASDFTGYLGEMFNFDAIRTK